MAGILIFTEAKWKAGNYIIEKVELQRISKPYLLKYITKSDTIIINSFGSFKAAVQAAAAHSEKFPMLSRNRISR